jgi:hypothetical protein
MATVLFSWILFRLLADASQSVDHAKSDQMIVAQVQI